MTSQQQILANILNVPIDVFTNNYLSIIDSFENESMKLVCVHYNFSKINEIPESVYDVVMSHRGTIIDCMTSQICVFSRGNPIEIPIDHFEENYEIQNRNSVIQINFEKNPHYQYSGGAVVRIWRYCGITFFSSFKKIDARKSFRQKDFPYYDIFLAGQNSCQSLEDYPWKENYTYYFLLRHRSFYLETRHEEKDVRIFFLETIYLQEIDTEKCHQENISFSSFLSLKDKEDSMTSLISNTTQPILFLNSLSIDVANNWLQYGQKIKPIYCNDIFSEGEACIIYHGAKSYILGSSAFLWRKKILQKDGNILRMLCFLTRNSASYVKKHVVDFSELEELHSSLQCSGFSSYFKTCVPKEEDPYMISFTNLFFALPITYLPDLFEAFYELQLKLHQLCFFLINIREDLIDHHNKSSLHKFPGLHGKKSLISFLEKVIPTTMVRKYSVFCERKQNTIQKNYPKILKDLYFSFYEESKVNPKDSKILIKAQIVVFVYELYGAIMYSLIELPSNYEKTLRAWSK
jgi:hypothetical protein